MPRFQPPPARPNLRAILLLLAASALSFVLAWYFSAPTAPPPEAEPRPADQARPETPRPAPEPASQEPARPDPLTRPGQAPANATPSANLAASSAPANASANALALALADGAPAPASGANVTSANATGAPAKPAPARAETPKPAPKASPKPAPEPPKPPKPAAPDKPAAASAKAEPATVLGLVTKPGKDEFILTIRTSRKIERYRSMNLDNPKKLAIDLMGKWSHKLKAHDLNAGFVRRLDVGDHPDFLRLVLIFDDRTKTNPIRATFSNGPDGLTVRVPR